MLDQLAELEPEALDLHGLAVSVQQGDKQVYGVIYRQLFDKLLGFFLLRVANRAVAEDLTSETFFVALERIHQYRGPNFEHWFFAIARSKMLNAFNKARKEVAWGDTRQLLINTPGVTVLSSPEEVLEHNERMLAYNALLRRLAWALRGLTPGQLECIRLRFFEGLEHSEVALRMGRKANATAALQFRGVQALADTLYAS